MSTSYKWSAEEEHLLRLLRATHGYSEISIEFKKRLDKQLPGFRCSRSSESIRKKCDREQITAESCTGYTADKNPVQTRLNTIRDIQEKYRKMSILKRRGVISPDKITRKILSLSDIHFPLARLDLLAEAIADHMDANIVVLNGDILEGDIFSSYEKMRRIAALDEYNSGFNLVAYLAANFETVVINGGNHDDRPARALKTAGFDKEASQILRPDLLARIANGERLDQSGLLVEKLDFSNVIYEQRENWYVKIGKTLFIHPSSRGSSKPGFTVSSWHKKFQERYPYGEYDSIVCGHTHQLYKGIVNSHLLMEQGCFADLMAYAWNKRVAFNGNSQNGYAVIYQDAEGNTCFNKSTIVFLGEVIPPKKSAIK
jgi:predicted phosphodiesterase